MENFPSIKVASKDLRLLLRRINKCIRDLEVNNFSSSNVDPQINDLIYSKAFEKIANDNNKNSDIIMNSSSDSGDSSDSSEPSNILNELI